MNEPGIRDGYKRIKKCWRNQFGYVFDCLTQSEARDLERSPNADKIRNRIVEDEQAGNCGAVQSEPDRVS